MAINTTSKEKAATVSCTAAATVINDLDFPTSARQDKAFSSLRAAYAMKGYALQRTDSADGPVTFWVERSGFVKHLLTIDAARCFLNKIGGWL